MSRQEERTYRIGRKRLGLADLKGQRERLRQDLEQFSSRKPDASVIASLKERLRSLDAEIAAAENERKREAADRAARDDEATETARPSGETSGRYSPRGWISDR